MALVNALEWNHTLKVLILTDNQVGLDVMTTLGGRLAGRVSDVCRSVSHDQLEMPLRYAAGRFDRIDLKELMNDREQRETRRANKSADFLK